MRFEELLERHERGELTQEETGELLGMSGRTFRRWRERYREEGVPGLADRRVGKPSPHRAAASELSRMRGLYEELYGDFTVKHFHEKLVKRHGYKLGYTVTRLALQSAGLVRAAPRRGAHRRKRPRRPMAGMLVHQDASRHAWLAGHAPLDLVATLDDATSELYSAFLVAEEGTASSFHGLAETISAEGLFCALYTDRGSHYFHTPEAGGKVSKERLTQVGRALAELGIEHIAAYSPEARGRSERAFRTLQDRLVKELALAGIATVAAANRFIAEVYSGTTPASRWRPRRRARPSCRAGPSSGARCCACARTARSATTTPCAGAAGACRYRLHGCARTSCAPRCACMNTPTERSPCSGDRTVSPSSRRRRRAHRSNRPRE